MSKVGLIQMTSSPDVEQNLQYIEQQVSLLAEQGAQWIVTPENSTVFGTKSDYHSAAEPLTGGAILSRLSNIAKLNCVWLIIGSMPIRANQDVTTTTVVINSDGEYMDHYDKIHMFDVDVADGHQHYRESEIFTPGHTVKVLNTPFGKLGLSICYDVRFPQLYSQLRQLGAQIILVPAAFTAVTGKAHWEVLLRARAIETQCWVIAVDQGGTHQGGRETWGHSMVVSPWGVVIAQAGGQAENLLVDVELDAIESLRASMPIAQHARFTSQIIDKKSQL
jgi:deaminated glutathione amidase